MESVKMSAEIILLTSSDEEDNVKPPPAKKLKPTLNLTECTLSIVPNKLKTHTQPEISVVLDSDDETEQKSSTKENCDPTLVNNKCDESSIENKNNIDLITLTDDENDESAVKENHNSNHSVIETKVNNNSEITIAEIQKNPSETVSIVDSDSESESMCKKETIKDDLCKKTNVSIMINDSDEEPGNDKEEEDEKGKEDLEEEGNGVKESDNVEKNGDSDVFSVNVSKTSAEDGVKVKKKNVVIPSTSEVKPVEIKTLFKQFLRLIEDKVVDSSFEEILPKKMPIIQKYFAKCEAYVNDKEFHILLNNSIDEIDSSSNTNAANCAVILFHKVCKQLKAHIVQTTVEIEEEDVSKVKTLEKTILLLSRKIKLLEETEVDFDADNNSAYIQLDRYQVRLSKVYKKYCNYIKRNPYIGRPVYDRITFVNSNHNIINQALTKKYKNSITFPNYYDLRKYIKKVVEKHKLKLTEEDITLESKKCFKTLGTILQKKRRQELYDSHLAFIECTDDPATKDISLENALKKSQKEGEQKIKEVCQKFVDLAERGEDNISTEKESSNESESDEDEDKQNNETKNVKKKEQKEEEKKEDEEDETEGNDEEKGNKEEVEEEKERIDEEEEEQKEEETEKKLMEKDQDYPT